MNETENKFVVSRAKTLAREFLTRRPDVVPHLFDDKDLDFVVTLDPSASLKIQGFSPFGVIVWGTDKSITSKAAASNFATRQWKSVVERSASNHKYFFPVIALVYPVKDEVGYYAWISEPHFPTDGAPQLIPYQDLNCQEILRNSLDNIVQQVAEWYTRLEPVLLSA